MIQTAGFDLPVDIQSVAGMREAVPILNETKVDVVAVRLQDTNAESLDLLTALRAFAPDAHVFFSARGPKPISWSRPCGTARMTSWPRPSRCHRP